MQLLQSQRLYFRQVVLWEDTWETPSRFWTSAGEDIRYSKIELANNSQYELFGTCWSPGIDSDAMWRIYSYKKDGIAIQTTIRKLFQSINFLCFLTPPAFVDGFIGPVRYENIDGSTFFDAASFHYPEYMVPSYIKRNVFAHEKEIRFLIHAPGYRYFHPSNELGIAEDLSSLQLPLLGNDFIEKLILDPRLTAGEVVECQREFDPYGLSVEKSSLYAVPSSTYAFSLSKEQCRPYWPKNCQYWDVAKRTFFSH